MLRSLLIPLSFAAVASTAGAHFVFVVPDATGHSAQVILSEDLKPDAQAPIAMIGGTKLISTDASGHDAKVSLAKSEHAYTFSVEGSRVIHGMADLGVVKRGEAKPGIIIYYPKTIIGDPFDAKTRLGAAAPMELVPTGAAGDMKLQFLYAGKPVPDADVDVIAPGGDEQTVTTDKQGYTPVLKEKGRYGAWARHVEETAGDKEGKHYDEVRQYATLVIDTAPAVAADATTRPALLRVSTFTPLPQPAASLGAVVCDGSLYIYGGHIAKTHSYSTAAVSHEFHRLNLTEGQTAKWETLASGPGIQGMNLATYDNKIYRVGGMEPRNKPGTDADNHSIAQVSVFDPQTKQWSDLPPLPQGRSSHDISIVDGKLYVIGGWTLKGETGDAEWPKNMLVLDLKSAKPEWKALAQPFNRRALTVATTGGKIYAIGGFTSDEDPSHSVDIYDVKSDKWSKGPNLPGQEINGFGPSAAVLNGKVYMTVADGSLYRLDDGRLDDADMTWTKIAQTTPRIVGRLVSDGSKLFVIGGADKGHDFDLIETVDVGQH